MFVRWQSRVRAERNDWALREVGDITWNAILVESVRVDGKPRQNHVAYLGSFSTRQAKISAQRVYTWEHMLDRLDRLSNRITIATNKSPPVTGHDQKGVAGGAVKNDADLNGSSFNP